jgi:hypothetical protein
MRQCNDNGDSGPDNLTLPDAAYLRRVPPGFGRYVSSRDVETDS